MNEPIEEEQIIEDIEEMAEGFEFDVAVKAKSPQVPEMGNDKVDTQYFYLNQIVNPADTWLKSAALGPADHSRS